ncbi:MAG: hypothetical protein PHQ81_02225 [Methanofollis sp.]|nr:hypothetical protein [Methanofollis sp.]
MNKNQIAGLVLVVLIGFLLAALFLLAPEEEGPQVSPETVPPGEIPALVAEAEKYAISNFTGAVAGDAVMVTSLDIPSVTSISSPSTRTTNSLPLPMSPSPRTGRPITRMYLTTLTLPPP